ncbi:XRE family transcriptional regulator [Candidatus Dependentiae bacterium]|nr:MAG: XRE family transcriptional regulator [Candidatus Dependentiae bacterium]
MKQQSFGRLLYERRSSMGVNATDLSEHTGIAKNAIHNIEAGAKRASPLTALVLVSALDIGPRVRQQILVAHAAEMGAVDVSTLDEAGLSRVVRVLEEERERTGRAPKFVPRSDRASKVSKQRRKHKR